MRSSRWKTTYAFPHVRRSNCGWIWRKRSVRCQKHYREVVLLRDIEEMSIQEISSALKLTRESTKARLHRARALIREYLRD